MHFMRDEIFEQPTVLKRCIDINIEKIEIIAKNIVYQNIKGIIFVARGSSDNAATYGKYLFEILTGIPCGLAAPSGSSLYDKSLKLKDFCVIGVSQSGQSEDICRCLEMYKNNGAMTIAITNNPVSNMAGIAEYNIDMNVGTEKAIAATKTFTAEATILDLLAAFGAQNNSIINQMVSIDKIIEEALSLEDNITQIIERFSYVS